MPLSLPSDADADADASSAEVRVVATAFLRTRPLVVGPFLAFTVAVLAIGGALPFQIIALGVFGSAFVSFFVWERARLGARVVSARAFARSLVATLVAIAVASTVTGALASPLLPMLFAPVGIGFAAFGRGRTATLLLGLLALVAAVLYVEGPFVAHLAIPDTARRIVLGAAIVDCAILLRIGVGSLATAHGKAAAALVIAGDEIVRSAEARTRELELVGSQVAHEMKNPLAAVRAIVEVMLESADERTKKRLTVAESEIARLGKIVDDYGSLAHPLETLRRAPVNVTELVAHLVALLDARAARAGITLVQAPSTGGAISFSLDRDRIKEALLNLLLNAIDATPAGGRVELGASLDREHLVFRIADTGKGMNASTLEKLGTPFFTGRAGGTGLGVALARKVAKHHGGDLRYESEPGRGTTATLRLGR